MSDPTPHALARRIRELNQRYLGPEGDAFALEELTPVARRFTTAGSRVLEVGCGYGRNLVALSTLPLGTLVGCDVAVGELLKARARVAVRDDRVTPRLVCQAADRLPFRDGAFDLVVLWQVLEHVIGHDAKRSLVTECVRVLKDGGHLLVETPNQWFPVDYHDNRLPFVHWLLGFRAREWLTWKVRGERYHPSEYLSLPALSRMLRAVPGVAHVSKRTRVYFAPDYRTAWRDLGGTRVGAKRVVLAALAPVHALVRPFGLDADLFLPSLRVVWRIDKRPAGPRGETGARE